MIKLEYVADTGVRVSFMIEDSEESPECLKLCAKGEMEAERICQVPQTFETLNLVARMLNEARRQAEGDETLWDGSRRRAEISRILNPWRFDQGNG